jgi:hypothetical protein
LSLSVAFFQYYYKTKQKAKITPILFLLKATSLFLLILLFLNPKIEKTTIIDTKPTLAILADNSVSLSYFKEEANITSFINELEKNKSISNKFNVQKYAFGEQLDVFDSLTFLENKTNIYKAISSLNELHKDKIAPIILLTDGNQTEGLDYEFLATKNNIYPVVFGDTISYEDLSINQINVNKYSYINNQFPVEFILNYEGSQKRNSRLTITNNNKIIFSKNISFSSLKKSITITTNLNAQKEGLQYFTAALTKINNEKNINNNSKNFAVEVIDEQTNILLLTSILHPDLGALKKAIESNKQRKVTIKNIQDDNFSIKDYQLVLLYQPNNAFNTIFNQIEKQASNYMLISGASTNWNLINTKKLGFQKRVINQTENYTPYFNDGFIPFYQENINFNGFPPLKDQFGEIELSEENQTLLFQKINGVQTKQPLLTTFEKGNQKTAILLGEGIWQWRAASFLNTNSFEEFDGFIGNMVQYLASNKKRSRLEVNAENMYPANASINIAAFYTDKNYKFDERAQLDIKITNLATNKTISIPFSLVNNSFQTTIENLASGEYTYEVSVLNQNIKKTGRFNITKFQIEEQFTNANSRKLAKLANRTGAKLFFKDQKETIIKELSENKEYYTIQKATTQKEVLINFKWILFIVISLLTAEWFLRKYHGKI